MYGSKTLPKQPSSSQLAQRAVNVNLRVVLEVIAFGREKTPNFQLERYLCKIFTKLYK